MAGDTMKPALRHVDHKEVVARLIAENPDKVERLRQDPALLCWFIGQGMRATHGKADPNRLWFHLKNALRMTKEDARD